MVYYYRVCIYLTFCYYLVYISLSFTITVLTTILRIHNKIHNVGIPVLIFICYERRVTKIYIMLNKTFLVYRFYCITISLIIISAN